MQAPAQKHLNKQNVGKNKEGRGKGDKNRKLQVLSGQQLMNMDWRNLRKMDIGKYVMKKGLWQQVSNYH